MVLVEGLQLVCEIRPAEVVERVEESTTEPNFKQDASPWKALG